MWVVPSGQRHSPPQVLAVVDSTGVEQGGGGDGGAGGGGVDGDERDGMQPASRPAVDPPPESEVGNEIPSVMYF